MKTNMFEIIFVTSFILCFVMLFVFKYASDNQYNSCVVEVIKLGQPSDVAVNICR